MGTNADLSVFVDTVIRLAAKRDAEAIGAVHHQAWMETYTGLLPDSFLATRSPEKSTAMFLANQCWDTVVAEAGGKIVGFCGWGAFRDPCQSDIGEIYGIYLLKEFQRMHLGQRMMDHAIAQLKANGYEKIGLWVLSSNIGAIRFYEKQGFWYSGIHKEANLGETISELLYVKESE